MRCALDLCPLSRRPTDISNGLPNPTILSLHPGTNYPRWDGGPEVIHKLLSVRWARDDFDANTEMISCGPGVK